jgi:2-methylcitrate dehydratase PrpD
MLVRGRAGLDEFTEAAIHDPIVLGLAKKVRYTLDPTIDYPRHFSGHVKITLDDGTELEENQLHPRGGLEDPLPPDEIAEKFCANARLALSAAKVERILDNVTQLERLPAISQLTDHLRP